MSNVACLACEHGQLVCQPNCVHARQTCTRCGIKRLRLQLIPACPCGQPASLGVGDPGWERARVWLDQVEQYWCVRANTLEGWVDGYPSSDSVTVERRCGRVVIRL